MKREQKVIKTSKKKSFPRRYLQEFYPITIASVLGILVIGANAHESSGSLGSEILLIKNGELAAPLCDNKTQTPLDWLGKIHNKCTNKDGANNNGGKYEQGDFDFVSHSS